ncbi:MAG: hypothetical protein ABI878_13900 [Acidobacteriota bacterium]
MRRNNKQTLISCRCATCVPVRFYAVMALIGTLAILTLSAGLLIAARY